MSLLRLSASSISKSNFIAYNSFVEFETAADLKKAVEALDGREFKDQRVTCIANVGNPSLLVMLSLCPSCC